jgi:hypothetical protein
MARQVNLVRSKVRQRMLTRLAESSGRPLECHGNVSPREMAVEGAKNPGTEPGVQVGPFAFNKVFRLARYLDTLCPWPRLLRHLPTSPQRVGERLANSPDSAGRSFCRPAAADPWTSFARGRVIRVARSPREWGRPRRIGGAFFRSGPPGSLRLSRGQSPASDAAPMMPELLRWIAGTIGVLRSSSGRKSPAFLETPPPTTNRSGLKRNSMCE